ncbi:MAG: hypothetical protein KGJ78_08850 [Alphaproteobacteria bacterium]|nr:hypothetical protein [Alphaproteobacteria bacterium]
MREIWMEQPEAHDYLAARDYLSLLLDARRAAAIAAGLRRAPLARHKAKDILRAGNLPILPKDNPFVARDLRKVRKGKALSPVLLVRGDMRRGLSLVIADGYHRICASWYVDENALIPCRVVPCP